MLQNTTFSGHPIFSQIIGLINKTSFSQLVKEHDAHRYCKQCTSWEHFICMLYCIMNNCTSLREVTQGIAAYGDKLNHLGITYTPPRSTFSDANARRDESFFGAVYGKLYKHYKSILSDSQTQNELLKRVFIIDSTTTLRRVGYYDNEKVHVLEFLTNIMEMTAQQVGLLYKMRWQIELLFKQLKQNFPLKYFLGDNENAIKIQIWCTLIANLLFTIIKKNIKKNISFSNLVSFARQHLFSYHKLNELIEKAEKEWRKKYAKKVCPIPVLFDE